MTEIISVTPETIQNQIYTIRGRQVMMDRDLAVLFKVETKHLKRQVKRNIRRFPEDFMFELIPEEYDVSRSQNGTLNRGENIKYKPMVFTEVGIVYDHFWVSSSLLFLDPEKDKIQAIDRLDACNFLN